MAMQVQRQQEETTEEEHFGPQLLAKLEVKISLINLGFRALKLGQKGTRP